jgi:hypothetical protein
MLSQRALGVVWSRVVSVARPATPASKALAAALSVLGVLCAYRFYDFWTTGFFVSDEYGYYFDAIHGAVYADRWFVGWINIFLFKALGINNVDAFSYLLPFYLFFWTAVTFIIFYKLLRILEFNELTILLSLLSCFVLISFILLSMGFLTEPVGLCMAMLGIYSLAKFLKSGSAAGLVSHSLLAGCFFGFAAGTREPYNAFLVAGGLIVAAIAVARRKEEIRVRRFRTKAVLLVSVLTFVIPSLFFLFVPTQAYSQQVVPISGDIFQSVTSNPLTSGGGVVSTTTGTLTTTITVNGTVTTTTTVTTSTLASTIPFYRQFVLTNTLLIFLGGLVLGWGPICFALGLIGFLILIQRAVRRRDATISLMLFTSITALGSYFVVSFIYAPDPYYFSFQNYSTVIRFSDTALPAYFLLAPVVISAIAKRRRYVAGLGVVVAIFLVAAVPVYQTYALSNLAITTGNPFSLDYRTPAAQVRDYVNANPGGAPFYIIGGPFGWSFTPGLQDLHSTYFYPQLSYADFTKNRWTDFYISTASDTNSIASQPQYAIDLIKQAGGIPFSYGFTPPYQVVSDQIVFQNSGDWFIHIQLVWLGQ